MMPAPGGDFDKSNISPQSQCRHLVILHLYGRNQADWADFVELRGQYRAVSKQCERVDIIVPRGTMDGSYVEGSLRIREVGGSPRNVLGFVISALRELDEIHRESPIDILWVQDPLVCGVAAWIASSRHQFPWVAEICNDFFDLEALGANFIESWLKPAVTTWSARRATRIRAVSGSIRDQLVRRGIPESKISVLCCPTDVGRFDPASHASEQPRSNGGFGDEPLVMFVGSLVYRKGVDLLIEAAAALRHDFPALRIAVVGDGPERASLEAQAMALGLSDVVRFWGRVPHEKLPETLAAADVVVLPSRNEGLPRCVVEALAMRKPVVATRISGNVEVVQDNETGILAEPTAQGIRDGLAKMLRLPREERERMGRLGQELVAEKFALEPVVERMVRELIDWPVLQSGRASQRPT
jgi:glycosyltransferase involved in cell wall biosynthesis